MAQEIEPKENNSSNNDPLETALISFAGMEPEDAGADIAGKEIARIKGYNAPLPDTGLLATQWQQVMRDYIAKGLDPNEDTTRVLKYFERQLSQAIDQERLQQPITIPSKNYFNLKALENPLALSIVSMAVGALITATTFVYENNEVETLYPAYSRTQLEKRSAEYQQHGSQIVGWWNDEMKEINQKRKTVLTERLDQNPLHNIGKTGFFAGLAGFMGVGGLHTGISFFRRRPNPEEPEKL